MIDSELQSHLSEATRPAPRFDAVSLLTLYVFLLLAIPSSLVFAPLGAAGGPSTLLALVLMALYIVMRVHPTSTLYRGPQPTRVAGLLFMCTILAAYISANQHSLPRLQQNSADRGIISAFGWLAVLLLAADGITNIERLKVLLRRIVMGATAMAVLGITQFFTGLNIVNYIVVPGLTSQATPTDLLTRGGLNRPSATAAHPLEFAAVLAISLPLAIHQARFAGPKLRLRRWLQVGLIAAALPITISRSAIFGLAVICLVLLPTWSKVERRVTYAILLLSTTILLIAVPRLFSALATILTQIYTGSSSTESRTNAIAATLHLIPLHPWFGVGFGTFLPQTYFYTDDQYVLSSIETGLIGLLALLTLFATGWLTARSLRRNSHDPAIRDFAQCLAAAAAASAVSFSTFDTLSFKMAAGLTFLLLGCIGAACRLLRPTDVHNDADHVH
jgi:hypothetical protein